MPKKNFADSEAYKYAHEHVNDNAQCLLVRLACKRFLDDLKKDEFFFDVDAAERVCRYFEMFKHSKGICAGQKFELRPDQKFFFGQLFGWKRAEDGLRRFRTAYREIPRKNGKSHEAACIGGYCLTSDGERGAEVYVAATSERQASLCFRPFITMARATERYKKTLKILEREVRHPASGGVFRPVTSNSDAAEGPNPSCAIYDEYHLWKNNDLAESLGNGMGGRAQPIQLKITTAGHNRYGPCYASHCEAVDILRGRIVDDSQLVMIYTVDEGDEKDIYNPAIWRKANPALGISKTYDFMERHAEAAKRSTRSLNEFLCKQLDIWTSVASLWLKNGVWDACRTSEPMSILDGKKCYCGLDLSNRRDLTAFVMFFPPQDGLEKGYVLPYFWVPAENAREKEDIDKVPYMTWERDGYVNIPETGTVKLETIYAAIKDLGQRYSIAAIYYDRWGIEWLADRLGAEGVPMREFGQGYKSMSPAVKGLEEKICDKELRHFGNPCLAWCVENVAISLDAAENIKMDKSKATGRIDGAVAMAMAVRGWELERTTEKKESIYEKRGLLML